MFGAVATSPQQHAHNQRKLSSPQLKLLGLVDEEPSITVLRAKSALSADKGRKGGLLRGLKRLGTLLSGSLSSSPRSPCSQQRAEASAHAGTLYYRGGVQDFDSDSIRLERSAHAGTVMHSSSAPDPLVLPSPVLTSRHPSRLSSLLKGHRGAESPPVMPHSPTTPLPLRVPNLPGDHQRQPPDVPCNRPRETVRVNVTPAIGGPISSHAKISSPVPVPLPSFRSGNMSAGVQAFSSPTASTIASPLSARSPPVAVDSQDGGPRAVNRLGGKTQPGDGAFGSTTSELGRDPSAAEPQPPVPPQAPPTTLLALNAAVPVAMRRRQWCLEDYQVVKRLYKGATSSVYKVRGAAVTLSIPVLRKSRLRRMSRSW